MSRRKFVPPITMTADERMFAALAEGYSTRFNILPVYRGITDPNKPWASAKKILDSILLQRKPHPTETIALMMYAAIIRAHKGIINGEEDDKGEMLLWERDPMTAPELEIYRLWQAPLFHKLTAELLQHIIDSPDIEPKYLAVVGLGMVPHLFSHRNPPKKSPIEGLHTKLLQNGIDKTDELAQLALTMGNKMIDELRDGKHDNSVFRRRWHNHTRLTVIAIYLAGGQEAKAISVAKNYAV